MSRTRSILEAALEPARDDAAGVELTPAAQDAAPLKILHLISSLTGGGAERQVVLLARAQRAMGDDVHIGYLAGAATEDEEHFHRIQAAGNYDPQIVTRIVRLIRKVDPDVIQTWLPQMDVAGGAAALMTRKPWVIAERSSPLAYKQRFVDRSVRMRVGRFANAVVANSPQGSSMWSSLLKKGAKAHFVPNLVEVSAISASPALTNKELNVSSRHRVVLFAGRLSEEKNVHLLLAAADIICSTDDVLFFVCGDGPLRQSLQTLIASSRNRDRIRYLGFRSDLWSIMQRSSVVVSLSQFEGHPNVILEAAASGKALVVSDIDAHRNFLDESMARFVEIDANACARAVIDLLDDDVTRKSLSEAAAAAADKWHSHRAAEAYRDVYGEAIAHRRAGVR